MNGGIQPISVNYHSLKLRPTIKGTAAHRNQYKAVYPHLHQLLHDYHQTNPTTTTFLESPTGMTLTFLTTDDHGIQIARRLQDFTEVIWQDSSYGEFSDPRKPLVTQLIRLLKDDPMLQSILVEKRVQGNMVDWNGEYVFEPTININYER